MLFYPLAPHASTTFVIETKPTTKVLRNIVHQNIALVIALVSNAWFSEVWY
jgi:hypothetical protein